MPVTHDDVHHVAELARLAIGDERLDSLVAELNGILTHMDVLSQVDTSIVDNNVSLPVDGTPLRSDSGGPLTMLAATLCSGERMRANMRDRSCLLSAGCNFTISLRPVESARSANGGKTSR